MSIQLVKGLMFEDLNNKIIYHHKLKGNYRLLCVGGERFGAPYMWQAFTVSEKAPGVRLWANTKTSLEVSAMIHTDAFAFVEPDPEPNYKRRYKVVSSWMAHCSYDVQSVVDLEDAVARIQEYKPRETRLDIGVTVDSLVFDSFKVDGNATHARQPF